MFRRTEKGYVVLCYSYDPVSCKGYLLNFKKIFHVFHTFISGQEMLNAFLIKHSFQTSYHMKSDVQ